MTDARGLAAGGWIDISVPLRAGIPIFEGDPTFVLTLAASIKDGAANNIGRLEMGVHTGTHLDAPSHFIDGGATSESIPLEAGIGPAWVVDATRIRGATLGASDLAGLSIPDESTRLLFKTRNSELWNEPGFSESFVGLDAGAAAVLARRGVQLVGIDYLSIAPFGEGVPTHRALLDAGVAILEGLDLRAVEPGPVELLCLPIHLVGSDGVPARALVRPRR